METNINKPTALLIKLLTEGLSEKETEELNGWAERDPKNKALVESFSNPEFLSGRLKIARLITSEVVAEEKEKLYQKLFGKSSFTTQPEYKKNVYLFGWKWAAAVAAVAASIAILLLLYKPGIKPKVGELATNNQTLQPPAPKTDKTLLILGDGRKVLLDTINKSITTANTTALVDKQQGQITYNSSPGAIGNAGEINTLITPTGGNYRLGLQDGTILWLNAESSVSYPTVFSGTTREITISGEVYLEVSKNKKLPFIVHVQNGPDVAVLGTRFTVNAYTDEPLIKTTLVEGAVQVITNNNGATEVTRIKPGQQARVDHENGVTVHEVNVEEATAFVDGLFFFHDADIRSVMRQLRRTYGISYVIGGAASNKKFFGKIEKSLSLTAVLEILKANGFTYTLNGNSVAIE